MAICKSKIVWQILKQTSKFINLILMRRKTNVIIKSIMKNKMKSKNI